MLWDRAAFLLLASLPLSPPQPLAMPAALRALRRSTTALWRPPCLTATRPSPGTAGSRSTALGKQRAPAWWLAAALTENVKECERARRGARVALLPCIGRCATAPGALPTLSAPPPPPRPRPWLQGAQPQPLARAVCAHLQHPQAARPALLRHRRRRGGLLRRPRPRHPLPRRGAVSAGIIIF